MSVITKDLGVATAYGYAKSKGYTGTEEEFAELMASYADVAQQAEAAAQDAEDAKDDAVTAKTDAQTAKTAAQAAQSAAETASGTATTKASEAAQSAQSAAGSASAAQTSATAASGSASTAQTAAQTATTKASEASSSASAASTAKTGAETARTGAQTAQTAAETAQANAEAAASSVSASVAQIEQNTEDISGLKNDFTDLSEKVDSAFVTETATGSIASFPDGADDVPVKDLTVAIEPVQSGSGDPSPDNVRPITGWTELSGVRCGKNLFWIQNNSITNRNITVTINNGEFIVSGSGSATINIPFGYIATKSVILSTNKVFATSTDNIKAYCQRKINADSAFDYPTFSSTPVVVNAGGEYSMLAIQTLENFSGQFTFSIQIELGSTATSYEPYTGQPISVNWETEAGTVYGGSVDVVSGVLTVDKYTVDLGEMTWYYVSGENYPYFRADLSTVFRNKRPASNATRANMICTKYKTTDANSPYLGTVTNCVCAFASNTNVAVYDTAYTSAVEFKNASSGVLLCYELAEPQTYQLTPQEVTTLLGTNNISVDIGNVSVTYPADTKLYIDKKIAELQA